MQNSVKSERIILGVCLVEKPGCIAAKEDIAERHLHKMTGV